MKIGNSSPHFPIAKALAEALGEPVGDAPLGLDISIKAIKPKRTLSQNAQYWVLVGNLAEFVGDTKNGTHEDILCEYHGYDVKTIRGRQKKIPKGRSHDQSVEDFSPLIEIALQWCAEAGVPTHAKSA